MPHIENFREFIIDFNNNFPLDRWYRKKYNIPFNSIAHRQTCQIDIYLEWLEDEVYKEHELSVLEAERKKLLYNKGEWISESEVTPEDQSKAFDDIDLNSI